MMKKGLHKSRPHKGDGITGQKLLKTCQHLNNKLKKRTVLPGISLSAGAKMQVLGRMAC
jgi:hypothetical protein